jgi:hypothetical protein
LKGKTMAKIRVDAQRWGEDPDYPQDIEDAGDPRLEQWNEERKREFGQDDPYYNPNNPIAQSFKNAHAALVTLRETIIEEKAEFGNDPNLKANITEIHARVVQALLQLNEVSDLVQEIGASYSVED